MSSSELAAVYAALILHDDAVAISADKILALTAAAGVEVEPVWASVFAKALDGQDLAGMLMNVGSGAGAAAPAAAAGGAAAGGEAKAEEKEEEKVEEESDDDMGFGLFD